MLLLQLRHMARAWKSRIACDEERSRCGLPLLSLKRGKTPQRCAGRPRVVHRRSRITPLDTISSVQEVYHSLGLLSGMKPPLRSGGHSDDYLLEIMDYTIHHDERTSSRFMAPQLGLEWSR